MANLMIRVNGDDTGTALPRAFPDDHVFGKRECLPRFVIILLDGVSVEDAAVLSTAGVYFDQLSQSTKQSISNNNGFYTIDSKTSWLEFLNATDIVESPELDVLNSFFEDGVPYDPDPTIGLGRTWVNFLSSHNDKLVQQKLDAIQKANETRAERVRMDDFTFYNNKVREVNERANPPGLDAKLILGKENGNRSSSNNRS